MKTTIALLLLPCAALLTAAPVPTPTDGTGAAPNDKAFTPAMPPLSTFANLDKKSPFEFDPPPPPPVDNVNNFEGVSLGGYCGTGNTLTVYLITGKDKKRITVHGDGSPFKKLDQTGYRVIGLNRGTSVSTTTVLLEKDGQQKEVAFEKETLTAKGGGAGGGGQVQMVPGPNGTMVPRPVVPRPSNAPAQAYQAPAAFIPGQSGQGQNNPGLPQQGQQGVINLNGQALNNQQMVNQLMTNPGQVQQMNTTGFNPAAGQPVQPVVGPPVPPRRRVVLPTER